MIYIILTTLLLSNAVFYALGFFFSMYFQHPIASIDENDEPFITQSPSKQYVLREALLWPFTIIKILRQDFLLLGEMPRS